MSVRGCYQGMIGSKVRLTEIDKDERTSRNWMKPCLALPDGENDLVECEGVLNNRQNALIK